MENITGTFTDLRDGKIYKTVKIGYQIWMAENLAFKTSEGYYRAYDNNNSNIKKYGFLYDWETAKKVCPNGWHLPTRNEFFTLLNNFGGESNKAYEALISGGVSGFSALLGGEIGGRDSYRDLDRNGFFWASSESGDFGSYLRLESFYSYARVKLIDKEWGFSVRCIQDE